MKGLRGIASLLIVIYHVCWAFDQSYATGIGTLIRYTPGVDRPYLLQLPFLRVLTMAGPFWVAMFFTLSGFVCSLKPLKLARAKQPDEGRKMIGKSIVRRVVRLAIPPAFATLCSWVACQLGLYRLAYGGEWWLSETPAKLEAIPAIRNLFWQTVFRSFV